MARVVLKLPHAGCSARLWRIWHNSSKPVTEDHMGLDFDTLSPQELLAAESAVLTMRSLMQAAKAAPQGQGMVCVETALHEKGFEHLRTILAAAAASHEGAQ